MTFGTMYLGELLWPLLRQHPALEVAIDLDDRAVDLLGSGYDLGIRVGVLADSSLIGRKLADIPRVLCASPAYLARAGLPAALEELPTHDCIGYAHLAAGQVWQFQPLRGTTEVRSIRVTSRFVANNGELMRAAAIAGLGLLMVPEFIVAEALRAGTLVRVLSGCRPVPTALHALYPRDRQGSPRIRAVVDHLVAAMRPRPPVGARGALLSGVRSPVGNAALSGAVSPPGGYHRTIGLQHQRMWGRTPGAATLAGLNAYIPDPGNAP